MTESQDLPMYSQRNPRYSHLRMGYSRYTIGSMGCLLCCLAHITGQDPAVLNRYLTQTGAYVGNSARLTFDSLQGLGWKMTAVYDWSTKRAETRYITAALEKGKKVVICIKFDAWTPTSSGYHWLEGVKAIPALGDEDIVDYYCYDPWVPSGTWPGLNLLAHYGQPGWDLARAVYMAVIYEAA